MSINRYWLRYKFCISAINLCTSTYSTLWMLTFPLDKIIAKTCANGSRIVVFCCDLLPVNYNHILPCHLLTQSYDHMYIIDTLINRIRNNSCIDMCICIVPNLSYFYKLSIHYFIATPRNALNTARSGINNRKSSSKKRQGFLGYIAFSKPHVDYAVPFVFSHYTMYIARVRIIWGRVHAVTSSSDTRWGLYSQTGKTYIHPMFRGHVLWLQSSL